MPYEIKISVIRNDIVQFIYACPHCGKNGMHDIYPNTDISPKATSCSNCDAELLLPILKTIGIV